MVYIGKESSGVLSPFIWKADRIAQVGTRTALHWSLSANVVALFFRYSFNVHGILSVTAEKGKKHLILLWLSTCWAGRETYCVLADVIHNPGKAPRKNMYAQSLRQW